MELSTSPSRSRGFTLIEVVLALALTAIVVGGILNGIVYADRVIATVPADFRGLMMADECIAVTRWLRDADGFDALTTGVHGLAVEDGRWMLVSDPDTDGGHTREIHIDGVGDNEKRIECIVLWGESEQSSSVSLVTLLSR